MAVNFPSLKGYLSISENGAHVVRVRGRIRGGASPAPAPPGVGRGRRGRDEGGRVRDVVQIGEQDAAAAERGPRQLHHQ